MIAFEDAPFTAFHRRVAISAAGGQFSDGYSLGIIGVALSLAKGPLGLTSWWIGALGAASLTGLFFGCLVAGSISDRFGRRPIFLWAMLLFSILALLQYHSTSILELFIWRLVLGFCLGSDYVASFALASEYSPTDKRGRILSFVAIAWTAGYLLSFVVGYLMRNSGPDAWRIALLSSGAPSLITFLLRFGTPESAVWLTRTGQLDKARDIIAKRFGPNIALPATSEVNCVEPGPVSGLFKPPLLRNLIVGCVFDTTQVIPWFALGTFLPIVLAKLNVGDGYTGALIYNVLLLVGGIIGLQIVDAIPRRLFLIYGFVLMAAFLAALIVWRTAPSAVTILLFSAFAFVMSAAGILQSVYPPELFPTEVRARGIGIVIACSRVGSASSTFLLPVVVERFGVYLALGACLVPCIVAAIVCAIWAPETRRKQLQ